MFIRFKNYLVLVCFLFLVACGGGSDMGYGAVVENDDHKTIISDDIRPLPFYSKVSFNVPSGSSSGTLPTPVSYTINTGLIVESKIPIVVADIEASFRLDVLYFDAGEWKVGIVTSSTATHYLYLFSEETAQSAGDFGMVIIDADQDVIFSSENKYFNPVTFAELDITQAQLNASFSAFINQSNAADIIVPFSNPVLPGVKLGAAIPVIATAADGGSDLFIFQSVLQKIGGNNSELKLGWGLMQMIPGAGAGSGLYVHIDLTQSIPFIDLNMYD